MEWKLLGYLPIAIQMRLCCCLNLRVGGVSSYILEHKKGRINISYPSYLTPPSKGSLDSPKVLAKSCYV